MLQNNLKLPLNYKHHSPEHHVPHTIDTNNSQNTAHPQSFTRQINSPQIHPHPETQQLQPPIIEASLLHTKLIEQKLLLQQKLKKLTLEKLKQKQRIRKSKENKLTSENPIWDVTTLIERFNKPEYQSAKAQIELLKFDAEHHAKEMALVETITRISYTDNIEDNETLGDGYTEDITLMLNTFTQDLAENGFNASRASIESVSFERAKAKLAKIAANKPDGLNTSNKAVLITSFPDDKKSGYHGVNSKHNWNKAETHHSFFYLLRVGEVKKDKLGNVVEFEIKTTQYRAWPNANQALEIHAALGQPIIDAKSLNEPIPNLLFANLIELDLEKLERIFEQQQEQHREVQEHHQDQANPLTKTNKQSETNPAPKDAQEDHFENLFKQILYRNSKEHAHNHTQSPEVNLDEFWEMQENYFYNFYLDIALPVFKEINELKAGLTTAGKKPAQTNHNYSNILQAEDTSNTPPTKEAPNNPTLDKKTHKLIQEKVDYLDKAFLYYSNILMGWIKLNNTNPDYTDAFKEKGVINKLKTFQQKLLLKILGQKQSQKIPTTSELKIALDIDHRLATKKHVSAEEKKKLLSVWGFFSFVGRFSSLLQCGTMAPFTAPLSIMKGSLGEQASLSGFSGVIKSISIPEQKQFLKALQAEEYVELDLTKAKPVGAKRVYTVPKSYLEGDGCIVDKNGDVLGPCMETVVENGVEVKKRIPLEDPRDTMAFSMTLEEFNKYIKALQKNIEKTSLNELDEIFQSSDFSASEKRRVTVVIKKLRQKLIKQSLGLQEFISGDLVNNELDSNNKWLANLVIELSFSINPVETLVKAVEAKLKDVHGDGGDVSNDAFFEDGDNMGFEPSRIS